MTWMVITVEREHVKYKQKFYTDSTLMHINIRQMGGKFNIKIQIDWFFFI